MAPWRLFSGNLQRLFGTLAPFFWKPPAPFWHSGAFFWKPPASFFVSVRGRLEKRCWRFPEKRRQGAKKALEVSRKKAPGWHPILLIFANYVNTHIHYNILHCDFFSCKNDDFQLKYFNYFLIRLWVHVRTASVTRV